VLGGTFSPVKILYLFLKIIDSQLPQGLMCARTRQGKDRGCLNTSKITVAILM